MLKHLLQFIHNHTDVLQVISAGIGGTIPLFLDIELGLKVLIGTSSLGYILWKWRVEYLKNKKEDDK